MKHTVVLNSRKGSVVQVTTELEAPIETFRDAAIFDSIELEIRPSEYLQSASQ